MKKPVNKFAVGLWLLAAVVLTGGLAQLAMIISTTRAMAARGDTIYVVGHGLGAALAGLIVVPVQLVALGVIIEMLDQIRWNALQRDK
jgi:hypothetical protein